MYLPEGLEDTPFQIMILFFIWYFSTIFWDEPVHQKQIISSVWKLMPNPVIYLCVCKINFVRNFLRANVPNQMSLFHMLFHTAVCTTYRRLWSNFSIISTIKRTRSLLEASRHRDSLYDFVFQISKGSVKRCNSTT